MMMTGYMVVSIDIGQGDFVAQTHYERILYLPTHNLVILVNLLKLMSLYILGSVSNLVVQVSLDTSILKSSKIKLRK